MKKLLFIVALLLSVANLSAQDNLTGFSSGYIEITGRADMEVTPDEIYISIIINEKDNKGKVSIDQQQKTMTIKLKSLGIDVEKDLVVQDMSNDMQVYLLRKNAVVSSKTFQLKVNSAELMGRVFESLSAMGISDINVSKTAISNIDELRKKVSIKAIQNAKNTAEMLTQAVGQTIGKAIYIQDYGYQTPRPYSNIMFAKSAYAESDSAPAPVLEFEKSKIEHSVLVRFILK